MRSGAGGVGVGQEARSSSGLVGHFSVRERARERDAEAETETKRAGKRASERSCRAQPRETLFKV